MEEGRRGNASLFFFPPVSTGEEGMGLFLAVKLYHHPEIEHGHLMRYVRDPGGGRFSN